MELNFIQMVINLLVIGVIGFLFYYTGIYIYKYTKVPAPIYYLVFGIIFGIGGLALLNQNFYFFANPDVFPEWGTYQKYALYLLFFGAGFNLSLKKIKKNGKSAGLLMFLPVYTEIIIMSIIGFLLLTIVGIKDIPFINFLFVVSLLALSSPTNVIPITSNHIMQGRLGDKNIAPTMITASILDNVSPLPLTLIILPIIQSGHFESGTFFASIFGFVSFAIISLIVGFIINLILSSISKVIGSGTAVKTMSLAALGFILFIVYALVAQHFTFGKDVFKLFGFVFALFCGASLASFDTSGYTDKIGPQVSKLFAYFGLPVIFLGVGAKLKIFDLLQPQLIIFSVIFIILAVAVKLFVTYSILNRQGYNSGAKKYGMSAFVSKGVAVLNFSVILSALNDPSLDDLIKLMISLGTFAIILTIPIGIILMVNFGKKWLTT